MRRIPHLALLGAVCLLTQACATAASVPGTALTPTPTREPGQTAGSDAVASASVTPGCGPSTAPPLDESFTPVQNRRGNPGRAPILGIGTRVASVHDASFAGVRPLQPSADAAGRPLQVVLVTAGTPRDVVLIYSSKPVGERDTIEDIFNAGGISVVQALPRGQDADAVVETVGKRASRVEVGPYPAALVHAEPLVSGVRTYNIYWSDGERDWSIEGATERPEAVIDLARSVYCG